MSSLRLLVLSCLFALAWHGAAQAVDLQGAKQQGLIGETLSGYIAAVKPTPEANQLVSEVNARRREEYQRISANNGQALNVVEKLAAEKLYERIRPGEYFQDGSGAWKRK